MEILDLYNSKKINLGIAFDRHSGEPDDGFYKLSVHIWILNDKGELLIQKRSSSRKANPNKWAFTGGAIDSGELSHIGAIREAKEELNVDLKEEDIDLLISFKREHDFVDVFVGKSNIDIKDVKIQEEEVSESKWVTLAELDTMIKNGEFVPAINLYYDLFVKLLEKNYGITK